jgi:L,D-transpeptidase YcbB
VFSDSMQYVVFRPYWDVTDSIAIKEIYPKAEDDPTFLERNNYEVVRGEGKERIRQKPGPGNALGLVKFIFPNDFAIYLHDTSEQELFDKDMRAFSHGCIRVERPEQLAQWVLGWSADSVQRAMQGEKDDNRVNLPQKIPVYIVYFTTYVRDGELYFGNDLYDRDDTLIRAVAGGATGSDAARRIEELRERIG